MDFHKATFDTLREAGHVIGVPYMQATRDGGARLYVPVDGVAMPVEVARLVATRRATVAQVAEALSVQP